MLRVTSLTLKVLDAMVGKSGYAPYALGPLHNS